ncbi:MAG: nucleotidyltransferase family protein [bacterium]
MNTASNAQLVAATLAGAWRADGLPLRLSRGDLARVSPLLMESGAAALGWRRVHATPALRDCPEANTLCQGGRLLALEDVRNCRAVEHVVALLNDAGIEPLIVKGWSVARAYADSYLRPYGDIDLVAPPGQYDAVCEVLRPHALPKRSKPEIGQMVLDCGIAWKVCTVDLHRHLNSAHMPPVETLFERSTHVSVGSAHARLLCMEDQLRHVITHFLRHGAWRPLWLCDVAALVEGLPADFDWTRCLSDDRHIADWIAATITLAHRLLGCRVGHVPASVADVAVPAWFERTVLREWDAPFPIQLSNTPALQIPRRLSDVRLWLRARWPNAVRATVGIRGACNTAPRLPYQIAHVGMGIRRYIAAVAAERRARTRA